MALLWLCPLAAAGYLLAAETVSGVPESGLPAATRSPVLTTAAQVLALSPEEAQTDLPVRLRGLATCYEHGVLLFVQDETGGVFVYYTGDRLPLRTGQYVELTGRAKPGRYSPIVHPERIQIVETGPAVAPRPVSLAEVCLGGLDAQWVESVGVVRSQKPGHNQLSLALADLSHRINVWVISCGGDQHVPAPGSLVRVRGVVAACLDTGGQPEDFQIVANTLADITVLRPGPADLFSQPPSLVREFSAYHVRKDLAGCARAQGRVTLHWPGRALFVQDSTGGLEVQTEQPLEGMAPGTVVDVAGFLGPVAGAPLLQDALVRRIGTNLPPQPARLSAEQLFHGPHDRLLVECEARYLGLGSTVSNCHALALQAGDHLLTALLDGTRPEAELGALVPGCRVRVTGVCRREPGLGPGPVVSLLLRSPGDLWVVGSPGPVSGSGRYAVAGAALLFGAGLAAALWLFQRQRRRTEHMLELQAALRAEMRQGEEQLRRSMEERERIARDLHDDIIQSIYAAGLNLEDCRRVVRHSPEQAESRLAAAVHTLNNAIQSVRGFIAGLEPKALNGREFKTALKSLALISGDAPAQFQIDVDPAAVNRLASAQVTQLLHIAKEAMSNSLRHAHASAVTVALQAVGGGIRLEIRDDGVGFDPRAVAGTGHGLRNMTARAREIGADLQMISTPGQGCRILITVPQRNPNEPD